MPILNDILYIAFNELVAFGVPEVTVKMGMTRNRQGAPSWIHIADPADARRKLVQYDSIPTSTIQRYDLPSLAEMRDLALAQEAESATQGLRHLHRNHMPPQFTRHYSQRGIPAEKAHGLAAAAGWLALLASVKGKRDVSALHLPGIETKGDLWNLVLDCIMEDKPHGLHRVSSLQVLKRHFTKWKRALNEVEKLDSLVHRHSKLRGQRTGNANAKKRTPESDKLLLHLYVNPDSDVKLNLDEIYRRYSEIAADEMSSVVSRETGEVHTALPALSLSTVRSYLGRPEVRLLDKWRHGNKYYRDFLRPYVIGKRPSYSWTMASSDGFVMPFWLKIDGKNTWKRPVCYVIFDVHSQAILGSALGLSEDAALMQAAYADMVARHECQMPMENQLDNYAKFYERTLERHMQVSFCEPYHPQSKYAESYIKNIKIQTLSLQPGNVGRHSLRSETNKRNPDKGNPTNSDVCYTWEQIEAMWEDAKADYHARIPGKREGMSRGDLLQARRNPEAPQISREQAVFAFGHRKENTIRRGYITLTYQGVERTYRVPNYDEVISHLPKFKVRVRFLPQWLDEEVYIYSYTPDDDPSNDVLLTACPLAEATARAKAEQTEADGRALGHSLKWRNSLDDKAEQMFGQATGIEILSPEEAEAKTGAGYTDKAEMKEAEATPQIPNRRKPQISRWRNA